MTWYPWVVTVAFAATFGFAAGAFAAWRVAGRRAEARMRLAIDALRDRHELSADRLRAAHTRALLELERQRVELPQQLAGATTDLRGELQRAEIRLASAHGEIGRLRSQLEARPVPPPRFPRPPLAADFAPTQPLDL